MPTAMSKTGTGWFRMVAITGSRMSPKSGLLEPRPSPTRVAMSSPMLVASAQVRRGFDAPSQASPFQGALWRLATLRTRADGLACWLVCEGIGPHTAAQLQRDGDVRAVQPALGLGKLVIGDAPVRAVAQ